MGWQDVIGGALAGFGTGDPFAWKKNKLNEMMQQFQMQKIKEQLEMQRDMHKLELDKHNLALKHANYTMGDLFGQPETQTVGNQNVGMAGGEEYAVPIGEPTKEVNKPLDLNALTQKWVQSDVPIEIATKAIPFLTVLSKEKDKPIPVGGKGIYKPGEGFEQAPWADQEEPKAPTVRTFIEGDKTVERQWNPKTQKWDEISSGSRYKPPGPDKGPTPFQLNKTATDYRKEFNNLPEIKEHNSIQPKIKSMEAAYNESKKTKNYIAVDQAMITLFNKLSDPSSVVRESEYARMAQNLPFVNALKGKVEKVMKGGAGLTDNDRENIMIMANLMKKAYNEIYNARAKEYRDYGVIVGANPDLIAKPINITKTIVERRKTASGKILVKYSDGSIGEE